MLQKLGSTHPNATYPPLRSEVYCTYTHKRLFLQPGPRFAAADGAERPPPVESLAADAFEMAQEVDDADEAALFLAFGDLLAALEGGGHGVFRADGHLPAFHSEG